MPRSGHEARRRLQQAALELYGERGFDRTTTAEIAERAGVTERTYFRHFPDKREVLFDGETTLRQLLIAAVRDLPETLEPLETLTRAFLSIEGWLREGRAFSELRHRVIAATPALRERELAKLASLADALATALQQRGVPARRAALAAEVGTTAFNYAVTCWYDHTTEDLDVLLIDAFDEVRALTTIANSAESTPDHTGAPPRSMTGSTAGRKP